MGEAILARANSGGGSGGDLRYEVVEKTVNGYGTEVRTYTFKNSLSKAKGFIAAYGNVSYYSQMICFDGKGNLVDDNDAGVTMTLNITSDTTVDVRLSGSSGSIYVALAAIF